MQQMKSLDRQGRFAGYASVFNVTDGQRDIILPGAFSRTIKGRASHIRLLWQHQQDEPIGVFDRIMEDSRGLYVEGSLLLSVRRAQEAHTLLKAGALNGLSIGYSPVHYRIDPETGIRIISQVDLWEISLVTFPANAAAQVTVIKGMRARREMVQAHVAQLHSFCRKYHFEAYTRGQFMTLAEKLEHARTFAALRRGLPATA